MKNGNGKSKTADSWCTPRAVVIPLHAFNNGPPKLDPCSNPRSIVGAEIEWYGPPHGTDGRAMPWTLGGLVFVNPPFSAKRAWSAQCAAEAELGAEIAALLPADTDTRHFHDHLLTANAICFWRGRLTFLGDVAYPARFPVVLAYWGRRARRFAHYFAPHGWLVDPAAMNAMSENLPTAQHC